MSPVLAQLDYRQTFLLLGLAGKHIRLMRCDGTEVTALPLPAGVPASVDEFTHDTGQAEHGKNHTFGVRFGSENARESGGHFRRDFMKAIDRGLRPLLRAEGVPLVLAGVEEETAAFAAVSDYAELLPEPLHLSPDGGATDLEMAQAATRILQRWSNAAERQAVAEYRHAGLDRRSTDFATIQREARAGRVQHLFVERNVDTWNAAAMDVLLHRGMVWLLEPEQMPAAVVMAAVLRYAGDKTGQ